MNASRRAGICASLAAESRVGDPRTIHTSSLRTCCVSPFWSLFGVGAEECGSATHSWRGCSDFETFLQPQRRTQRLSRGRALRHSCPRGVFVGRPPRGQWQPPPQEAAAVVRGGPPSLLPSECAMSFLLVCYGRAETETAHAVHKS